jgi:hypothetical protein
VPVSIVASDHDPAVPFVALDRGCKSLPDATLDIIKDARHFSKNHRNGSPARARGCSGPEQ